MEPAFGHLMKSMQNSPIENYSTAADSEHPIRQLRVILRLTLSRLFSQAWQGAVAAQVNKPNATVHWPAEGNESEASLGPLT
jgi:hypothetical protein